MINIYIREFIAVCKHLKNSEKSTIRGDYMYAKKDTIIKMLEKNAYELPAQKLKVWRDLRWIDVDDGRLTTRIRIDGKLTPHIKISLKVYNTLQNIA